MYQIKCICGNIGHFDEKPEGEFKCWDCKSKAELFRMKRNIVSLRKINRKYESEDGN